MSEELSASDANEYVSLALIAREWTRLGCVGFGGPPTHILLLRRLCVEQHRWLDAEEFEDAIATTNLLPGPASTQLAIYCAWRVRGTVGGIVGGLCFICPGLLLIIGLSAIFLARHPPVEVLGAAAGAGAAVPAVALNASRQLVPTSWKRIGSESIQKLRWVTYAVAGAACAAWFGEYLVAVLVLCGAVEILVRRRHVAGSTHASRAIAVVAAHSVALGGFAALAWEAFKVGALSYGGGFVIIPLMQHDSVVTYHWMTGAQFLNAVALGQITPGPIVQTVAVVGYAAAGVGGALLAATLAFAPSFGFVLVGGSRFDKIRANSSVEHFLTGAGPAVIGAIAGSAIPLASSLHLHWQIPILVSAALWLMLARRSVVSCLVVAGVIGTIVALAGASV
jgi:chromate transporter